MKIIRSAVWLLFTVMMLLFPFAALCANAVPEEVLFARAGLVRVCCEKEDGSAVLGTGFAVGQDEPVMFIVTNRHVTQDSKDISVLCADALKVGASVYLENENTDLCVLKLSTPLHGIKPLVLEDAKAAKAGDAIYALGFPLASDVISIDIGASAEDVTVTDGIVSAEKTGKLKEDGASVTLLQVNASLSGGNSGGPLLNGNGHVVGVNTLAVLDAQDINAALSADALTSMLSAAGIGYQSASEQAATHTITTIFIVAAGTVIIAAGIIFLLKRKKRTKNDLTEIHHNPMGQIEDELQAILPVVEQVREQHKKGRFGLDICPQNIVMSKKGALLRVKSIRLSAGGGITPCPGYSAPEWYTGGAVGPWSDVYAVSALVYKAMTGRKLPAAFERGPDETLFNGLIEKYQALADAISQGLFLDISRRLISLDTLSVQIQACLIGHRPAHAATKNDALSKASQIQNSPFVSQQVVKPAKLSGKKRMAVVSVLVGALLLGGTWLVNEVNYAQAVTHVESGAYSQAQRSLKGMFAFYGDATQLSQYAEAGLKLESGEYDAAARLFSGLRHYRHASEMVSEAYYRHAQYLMQKGSYTDAETLLDTIGGYKDAAQMKTEIMYQNACTYFDAGLYLSALEAFKAIDPYNDSAARIDESKAKLYEAGLYAISTGEMDIAASNFAAASGFKQSDAYVRICGLLTGSQSGSVFTKEDYNAFLGLADMMDITPYLTSDALITHYLCGSWQDDADNLFVMDADGNIQYNLPGIDGAAYSFRDGVLSITQSDGTEAPMFGFSCVDLNTVALYCYEDGMTYILARQL